MPAAEGSQYRIDSFPPNLHLYQVLSRHLFGRFPLCVTLVFFHVPLPPVYGSISTIAAVSAIYAVKSTR